MNAIRCFAQYMIHESLLTWNRLLRDIAERKPLCFEVLSDTVALQTGGVRRRRDGKHHGSNPQYHGTRHFRKSFSYETSERETEDRGEKTHATILDTIHDVLLLPVAGRTRRHSRSYIRIRTRFVLA